MRESRIFSTQCTTSLCLSNVLGRLITQSRSSTGAKAGRNPTTACCVSCGRNGRKGEGYRNLSAFSSSTRTTRLPSCKKPLNKPSPLGVCIWMGFCTACINSPSRGLPRLRSTSQIDLTLMLSAISPSICHDMKSCLSSPGKGGPKYGHAASSTVGELSSSVPLTDVCSELSGVCTRRRSYRPFLRAVSARALRCGSRAAGRESHGALYRCGEVSCHEGPCLLRFQCGTKCSQDEGPGIIPRRVHGEGGDDHPDWKPWPWEDTYCNWVGSRCVSTGQARSILQCCQPGQRFALRAKGPASLQVHVPLFETRSARAG